MKSLPEVRDPESDRNSRRPDNARLPLVALPQDIPIQKLFSLSIHEESFSINDIILNSSTGDTICEGQLLQLRGLKGDRIIKNDTVDPNDVDTNKLYVFSAKAVNRDLLLKQPSLQLSISRRISQAFGFEKGDRVLVSTADHTDHDASHVEVVFRDQYLARADMWRLVSTELVETSIFKGQSINFVGSINATIKTIYVHGEKVQSAFFSRFTKPIFRSESARYILFIQMSKEMWDFDAEGTGEIMFDKVINGFLPELFKRWLDLKVKHLVSIVLFTRMVYDDRRKQSVVEQKPEARTNDKQDVTDNSKDFYRIVVSDMASGEWANILRQLKREFKVFLRDISLCKPEASDHQQLVAGPASAYMEVPAQVIAGYPSVASKGNVLEAINLASSQFSSDYIDRDLVRTGVSILVISPGTGVYEVDYKLLLATTDNLIDNGVSIDLVCLSRMPLHSVPLFKYRASQAKPEDAVAVSRAMVGNDDHTPTNHFLAGSGSPTPPAAVPSPQESIDGRVPLSKISSKPEWSYGIPHWVDISFWTSAGDDILIKEALIKRPKSGPDFHLPQHKTFVPRVRMYELQMMGVMENAISNISIPHLSQTSRILSTGLRPRLSQYSVIKSRHHRDYASSNLYENPEDRLDIHERQISTSFDTGETENQNHPSSLTNWMDEYDDLVFRHPSIARKRVSQARSAKFRPRSHQRSAYSPSIFGSVMTTRHKPSIRDHYESDADGGGYLRRFAAERKTSEIKTVSKKMIADGSPRDRVLRPKGVSISRKISFGPRGLGVGTAKALASTQTDHGEVKSTLSRAIRNDRLVQQEDVNIDVPAKGERANEIIIPDSVQASTRRPEGLQSTSSQSTRPIPIRKATAIAIMEQGNNESRPGSGEDIKSVTMTNPQLAVLQKVQSAEVSDIEIERGDEDVLPVTTLSPSTKLAPWLTVLNPSNPSKTKASIAMRLGRWHHVFPRPLKTSQIKWKSLCSPAAIPLTTEDFPSAEELGEEYQVDVYQIEISNDGDEHSQTPRLVVMELVTFRLSRGFQIVIGERLSQILESSSSPQTSLVFDERALADPGDTIYLSRGNIIHKMTTLKPDKIEIKQYVRYDIATDQTLDANALPYKPAIRSMFAGEYDTQSISIAPQKADFDWKVIDSFIAGHERPKAEAFVGNLRPWRARFVLIPVDPPSNSRRPIQLRNEDDEEEIRLEGIKKLTQVWQRFRYIPPEERRFQAPLGMKKDTNPLDIMYQTRNPSAIVAAESESVAESDMSGRSLQLLPECDLYQRSSFKISELATLIQSDKGVRMLDRRWHWRLHYNCFIGFELTSWLLQNFRDIDTRDEAVELGNELMKSGLFSHVEQRHNFRDGNYFYQVSDEYRTTRELRGWFGRGKQSVPSTPALDESPKGVFNARRSRTRSNSNSSSESSEPSTPVQNKRQKIGVALSKSLLYDVDHRKRSYRPELINLHYDRLHNPDNCYHIRIEWINTTPKLIRDAIVSWATSVDRFGLRLVAIPIGEASSITTTHPFRCPYRIKLELPPPSKQPQNYFDDSSLTPRPKVEKHFYQKAIMKRFNFVLDFEAASEFPSDVDVTYSWGKPEYRFPQYIHRSGMLIAQISDEGDFLVVANRLYNKHGALATGFNYESNRFDSIGDGDSHRGTGFFRSSPHRGSVQKGRKSPHESPYNSPSLRASLEIPTAKPSSSHEMPTSKSDESHPINSSQGKPHNTPLQADDILRHFESFCRDDKALKIFYNEVMSKPSTPGANTPLLGGKTPNKGPQTPSRLPERFTMDSNIPVLALPETLIEKEEKKG